MVPNFNLLPLTISEIHIIRFLLDAGKFSGNLLADMWRPRFKSMQGLINVVLTKNLS